MFGRKQNDPYAYDQCEVAKKPTTPDFASYHFVDAVRAVVNSPQPTGPKVVVFAEEGSIANPRDMPDNMVVIYFKPGSSQPTLCPPVY